MLCFNSEFKSHKIISANLLHAQIKADASFSIAHLCSVGVSEQVLYKTGFIIPSGCPCKRTMPRPSRDTLADNSLKGWIE